MATHPGFPALIPRDVLFGNPEIDAPQLSPDATKLAYLAPSEDKMSVWVRTIGKNDDRVVARDPSRPIAWFAWQGDGAHVLYMQDAHGDENFHVFQAALDGGASRDLTPGEGVRVQPLRIDPHFPNEVLVLTNARDRTVFDVWRIDLGNNTSGLDTENPGDVLTFLQDNAFVVRAAVAKCDDGSSILRVRDNAESDWRTLDEYSGEDATPSLLAFSSDNGWLYVTTAKGSNASRLLRYDVQTGDSLVLLEDPMYAVERVYIDPAGKELAAAAVLRERLEWNVLNPDFEDDFAALAELNAGDFTIESASADGETLVVACISDTQPPAFCTYDRRTKRTSPPAYTQPQLLDYSLAAMQPFSFAARDGMEIHGYLSLPPGVEPRALPSIMFVHGGPWYRDRWGYEAWVQWLANRGYAVIQVNFRGSTGYGKAYLNAGNMQWAGAMRTDLLDARDWAVAQGIADPKRFGILGGSYGGYAVLAALAFTPDAFTCGVDIVGPSNLNTLLEAFPPYWKAMRSIFTQRMGEDATFLETQSPLFKAHEIRAPLLIAHGANDPRVKQDESDRIVRALRHNGTPVTYVVFEDEGHGFANPKNSKRFSAVTEAFLSEHLGGRAEPPHEDEDIAPFLRT